MKKLILAILIVFAVTKESSIKSDGASDAAAVLDLANTCIYAGAAIGGEEGAAIGGTCWLSVTSTASAIAASMKVAKATYNKIKVENKSDFAIKLTIAYSDNTCRPDERLVNPGEEQIIGMASCQVTLVKAEAIILDEKADPKVSSSWVTKTTLDELKQKGKKVRLYKLREIKGAQAHFYKKTLQFKGPIKEGRDKGAFRFVCINCFAGKKEW